MAFPTRDSLQLTWVQLSQRARTIKAQCEQFNVVSAAGPVESEAIERIFLALGDYKTYASGVAATPGLAAYVQEQYSDPLLDIAAEYTAMMTQIDSALAWMVANVPQSGGYVLLEQWLPSGVIMRRNFDTASLAGLRTVLAAVAATIE